MTCLWWLTNVWNKMHSHPSISGIFTCSQANGNKLSTSWTTVYFIKMNATFFIIFIKRWKVCVHEWYELTDYTLANTIWFVPALTHELYSMFCGPVAGTYIKHSIHSRNKHHVHYLMQVKIAHIHEVYVTIIYESHILSS